MSDDLTIDVQPTPNVNALKFLVNRRLTEGRGRTFRSATEAGDVPLAARLLGVSGVVQVFVLNDFVTVTREPEADWGAIVPVVEQVLRETL